MTRDTSMGKTSGRPADGGPRRPRRELLTGAAAAALGVITGETLAGATPAQATQGQPVILGQDNINATARTGLFTTSGEQALLADPSTGIGVVGTGGDNNGAGVKGTGVGNGTGVTGFGGPSNGGEALKEAAYISLTCRDTRAPRCMPDPCRSAAAS